MNKLLLSALHDMSAVQLLTPAMARNSADDPSDHLHQGREHDNFIEHRREGHHADDANEDRRGKNASGHRRHGRRATDLPGQDDHDDDANNPASHR